MPAPLLRFAVVSVVVAVCRSAAAEEPLHARIDALILEKAEGAAVAGPADDAEFLRRVWLDLAGRIPSAAEARAFFADKAPDKRAKLIDALLAGPEYPRRMQELMHVMLMERRGDDAEWQKYLHDSFAAGKPMNTLVAEILSPDAKTPRGAGYFLIKRLEKYGENPTDYPGLTRDVGRLLLGKDLQCAQCHNHLFVNDYKQKDFQGLFAIFQNTFLAKTGARTIVAEKPMTAKIEYMSVFDKVKKTTGPRIPGGQEFAIPEVKKGEEYAQKPDKKSNSPGVPKFSPLGELAKHLPTAENAAFAKNFANRLWWMMMGRGLVHPLDLHHTLNPPSHPELLDLLAAEFVAGGFDAKRLLREIARSRAYQRSSVLPAGKEAPPAEKFLVALEKRMSGEQIYNSLLVATGGDGEAKADEKAAKALRDRCVKAFANPPQEPETEFAPSLQAALFVRNDEALLARLAPKSGNLTDRLAKLADAAVADEAYLAVLTRLPAADERAEVAAFLAKNAHRRPAALADLVWALLAGTEFCINH